jgi:hypothetical protein
MKLTKWCLTDLVNSSFLGYMMVRGWGWLIEGGCLSNLGDFKKVCKAVFLTESPGGPQAERAFPAYFKVIYDKRSQSLQQVEIIKINFVSLFLFCSIPS